LFSILVIAFFGDYAQKFVLHDIGTYHKNSTAEKNCLSSADMFLFIPTTDVMFIFRTQKTSSLLLFLLAAK